MKTESETQAEDPSPETSYPISRREFMSRSGKLAAASAFGGAALPFLHAAENNNIRLALIGCGGRGSGAKHVRSRLG